MSRLGSVLVLGLGLVGLAVACGGSSESNFSGIGEGGDGNGGSSGSKAGSSNSAAGTPDDGALGGVTSSSTGGADPGAAGAGGTMMMPVVPDPAVREACDGWCEGVVEAACPNSDTMQDCLFGCRAVAGSVACNAGYGALFECAENATFTCDDNGDPVPQGCEVEYATVALCVFGNPDTTLAEPCDAYCGAAVAAECPNSTPAGECSYGCQLASTLVAACTEDWKAFIACAEVAEVSCNAEGDPTP